ncbi:MAG: tetratricopeptide repeat protein [Thermodesulfobacteriota bacterium]
MARKTRREFRRQRRTAFWITVVLILGAFSVLWWVWPGLYSVSPRFDSLLLEKNADRVRILRGETLHLHPQDKVRILEISTNITFNMGVRLFARGFDVTALCYEKSPIADLLPKKPSSGEQRFRVQVLHQNRDMGHIEMVVEPFVEDWIDKAERMIEPARKVEVLKEALKFAPQDRRIRERLIEEYRSHRKWHEAAELLETAAKEEARPDVLERLVEVYESMANTEGVLSSLRRLLEISPGDSRNRLRYAAALEKVKRNQEAAREYEAVLRATQPGERLGLYRSLGYLYAETGDIPKAILNYRKALELDKEDPNLHYNLSTLYEREGDENRAFSHLEEALRLRPGDAEGRLRLAAYLVRKGKLLDAERHLAVVIAAAPGSMEALLLLSQIAEKSKDPAKLRDVYTRILSLDPDNETVLYNLGVLEYEAGDYRKGVPLLQKYSRIHAQDADVHRLLFDMYRKEKKEDLALHEAQVLSKLNPGEVDPYHYMFEYWSSRGKYQEIVEPIRSGIRRLPENLDLRRYLVLAYLKTGREANAMEQMQEILKRQPNDLTLLLQLARLQEKQGKGADALETYQRILSIAPGHEEAGEAYLRLRLKVLPR